MVKDHWGRPKPRRTDKFKKNLMEVRIQDVVAIAQVRDRWNRACVAIMSINVFKSRK